MGYSFRASQSVLDLFFFFLVLEQNCLRGCLGDFSLWCALFIYANAMRRLYRRCGWSPIELSMDSYCTSLLSERKCRRKAEILGSRAAHKEMVRSLRRIGRGDRICSNTSESGDVLTCCAHLRSGNPLIIFSQIPRISASLFKFHGVYFPASCFPLVS